MEKNEIIEKLLNIIETHVELIVPVDKINYEDELKIMGVDSMALVEVIAEIEIQYNIFVDDSELGYENFKNINKIVSYIEKKQSQIQ